MAQLCFLSDAFFIYSNAFWPLQCSKYFGTCHGFGGTKPAMGHNLGVFRQSDNSCHFLAPPAKRKRSSSNAESFCKVGNVKFG